jgi:hypothetical protein
VQSRWQSKPAAPVKPVPGGHKQFRQVRKKIRSSAILANAGIQNRLILLDPGIRRDDGQRHFSTFYDSINF